MRRAWVALLVFLGAGSRSEQDHVPPDAQPRAALHVRQKQRTNRENRPAGSREALAGSPRGQASIQDAAQGQEVVTVSSCGPCTHSLNAILKRGQR